MNKKLKQIFIDKGIIEDSVTHCEYPRDHNCNNWCCDPAHRHKRGWYKGQGHLLNDFNQVLILCRNAHELIEFDRKLTEEIFLILRGEE